MKPIEFTPDLATCVQTLAEREYERTMALALAEDAPDAGIEARLTTLQAFLQTTDFPSLRGSYERALAEGRRVVITVHAIPGGAGHEIEIGWQDRDGEGHSR